MTNQDTTSIDEKINDRIGSYGIHDKTCGVKITYDLGNCDCQHLELKALISDQVAKARIEWLDEQISHVLQDIYPTDLFAEPTKEDFDRINKYDANLHTRLHCDGIRHGLHILRREARGLSARDELATLNGVKNK